MKTGKSISHLLKAAFISISAIGIASCTDSPSSPSQSGSSVVMRTQLDNTVTHPFQGLTENHTRALGALADSIQVTSAAFVVSDFELRSDANDIANENFSEETIRREQFLLAFDANREYIGERIVLADSYLRSKFTIHPLVGKSDSLALSMGPLYTTLFANSVADNTIVIHGFVWKDGLKMPFSYSSKASGSGSVVFDSPLVIAAGAGQTEVLIHFSGARAFSTGEGTLMDPRDSKNTSGIESNLKVSLSASMSTGS